MPDERYFSMLFEYAPISLWEQDFSDIKAFFDSLRSQGVTDLDSYLDEHPAEIEACMGRIRVVRANRQTLRLYEVQDEAELVAHLGQFFRDEMRTHFRSELRALWNGELTWAGEGVNYTLSGKPIDILLSWRILPGFEQTWRQVLIAIEDITPRKQAERALLASENRLRGLFDNSPISLWEEDYSQIKALFDRLRSEGVEDFEEYIEKHPETVAQCMSMMRVIAVNRKTLEIFKAASAADLLQNLDKVFRDEMGEHFRLELLNLWKGELSYETEGINYALDGEPVYVHLHLSVYPGYEETFERVVVALEDITARHKAEEYLRYLGTHDVMTGLYNRMYFQEELKRLGGGRQYPVSILVTDLDGLKKVNDSLGHEAGDKLIRRAAEVLKAGFRQEDVVARIGGDEFAVIMPKTDAATVADVMKRLNSLCQLNNKFYGLPLLEMSLGAATVEQGDLEQAVRLADNAMYADKRKRKKET